MAERIVSPGVFTQENDLSFLPIGIGEIGAVIIGRTEFGPAFMPVVVRSMNEFEQRFGSNTNGTYVPYTVKEYIRSAGAVTIVRVLGLDGYTNTSQVFMHASGSSTFSSESGATATTDRHLLGVIHSSAGLSNGAGACTGISFGANSAGALATASVSMSFNVDSTSDAGAAATVFGVNAEFQVHAGGTTYRFLATSDVITQADSPPLYYYETGSTSDTSTTALANKINNATTLSDLITVGTSGSVLHLSASSVGTAGNDYKIVSGTALVAPATYSTNTGDPKYTSYTWGGGLAQTGSGDLTSALTGTGLMAMTTFKANASYSFSKTDTNYFKNVLGVDPGIHVPTAGLSNLEECFVYSLFSSQSYGTSPDNKGGGYGFTKASASLHSVTFAAAATAASTGTSTTTSGKEYSAAGTPWVIAQTVNGANSLLFKFHTLSHGNRSNKLCKIQISSIKAAGEISGLDYGGFTVIVRKFDDTDTKIVPIETYNNCNLDPNSPNYIARLIGDKNKSYDANGKLIVTGDYNNMSKYVRVEVHENVRNAVYSDQLVPFGHEAYLSPFYDSTYYGGYPAAALVTSRSSATDTKTVFGFNFDETILKNGMDNYLAPLSDNANAGWNSNFKLEQCTASGSGVTVSTGSKLHHKKFALALQGGYDGVNPAFQVAIEKDMTTTNTFGFSFANTSAAGYVAYKKAIDTISNPDEIDINMIVTPGILTSQITNVPDKVIEVCEDRGDCFYVVDGVNSPNAETATNAIAQASNYDTNYAAMYYPWVKILDASVNRFVWVPPSVVIPGVIAYNDKVAFPWFAPAGLNRGSLNTIADVYTRLTHGERDDLYEGKVNPIAVFPNTGVTVWGQKTLQTKPSALDRINVRRLLIKLKKFIASSTKYLVFENNTTATRNRFLNIVNPYLETVQQQQGLYAFKVVMDESNNTPDVVDRNQMVGEIFLQPAKAAEFIIIDFNILRTGASFEE